MDNQPFFTDQSYNQNLSPNPKHIRNAIIATILLFFVIIITIAILAPLSQPTAIAPVSSDISSHLSGSDLSKIETSVKNHLSSTYNTPSDELNSLSIVIREDTFKSVQNNTDSILYTRFIIDLNEPKYSYLVTYRPSIKSVNLTCPSLDQTQDPNLFCIADSGYSTIDADLGQYLPYQDTTTSGTDFSISHHGGDSYSDPYLSIYASVCGDEAAATEVETAVKDWIRSKGIPNPDIIPLHFPHSYCNDRD